MADRLHGPEGDRPGLVPFLTILEDDSRYIIAWKLCTAMKTTGMTETPDLALQASGCDQATVLHEPRRLSDNGSGYISGDLANRLDDRQIDHVRGAPCHPQTKGQTERWHQTLKNRISLENDFLPGALCPVLSSGPSRPSSVTTITDAITRA